MGRERSPASARPAGLYDAKCRGIRGEHHRPRARGGMRARLVDSPRLGADPPRLARHRRPGVPVVIDQTRKGPRAGGRQSKTLTRPQDRSHVGSGWIGWACGRKGRGSPRARSTCSAPRYCDETRTGPASAGPVRACARRNSTASFSARSTLLCLRVSAWRYPSMSLLQRRISICCL